MRFPNLKAEMARNGIDGNTLAAEIGVTPISFSRWMNGHSEITLSKAFAIARVLDCTVEYLFDEGKTK